jgi:anti-anti-sigma regulatory factor
MPTHITQEKDDAGGRIVLRVTGDLLQDDALLLEKITKQTRADFSGDIAIDLADLDLMDSESAPILRRLQENHGVTIEGTEIFLQTVIDDVEGR